MTYWRDFWVTVRCTFGMFGYYSFCAQTSLWFNFSSSFTFVVNGSMRTANLKEMPWANGQRKVCRKRTSSAHITWRWVWKRKKYNLFLVFFLQVTKLSLIELTILLCFLYIIDQRRCALM